MTEQELELIRLRAENRAMREYLAGNTGAPKIDVDGSYSAEADERDGTGLWVILISNDDGWEHMFGGVYSTEKIAKEAASTLGSQDDIEIINVELNVAMIGAEFNGIVRRPKVPFGWRP